MALDAATIERLIKEGLPDAQVTIEDLRGDGDHYAALVVSPAFKGKSRIQQHQIRGAVSKLHRSERLQGQSEAALAENRSSKPLLETQGKQAVSPDPLRTRRAASGESILQQRRSRFHL